MTLFPIKPVGCCNNGKCYVSQREFNDLDERVTELEEDVSTMETVDFTIMAGAIVIPEIVEGLYIITDAHSTHIVSVKNVAGQYLSTIGAYAYGGTFLTTVALAIVSTDITIRLYNTEGPSSGFTDSVEVRLIPF